eukprot:TRINITY_DN12993_c0_g1_i1.p1 TRINITY_DN12993_c0_g1~~TRINITY_DN12993_c0_g1_i1.p1  ORF type:complete len:142 (+),score=19.53 TRINITY_DN12993_c0_g1_i1:88-513(+)
MENENQSNLPRVSLWKQLNLHDVALNSYTTCCCWLWLHSCGLAERGHDNQKHPGLDPKKTKTVDAAMAQSYSNTTSVEAPRVSPTQPSLSEVQKPSQQSPTQNPKKSETARSSSMGSGAFTDDETIAAINAMMCDPLKLLG